MRFLKIRTVAVINAHLFDYPTPLVGYLSSFGSLSGICLVIQIVTGIFLAAHYTPHVAFAFLSVQHIIRNVNDGWIFRYYHSNGASIFFFCLYIHIYVNFSSESDDMVWLSGVFIYFVVILAAFIGYVLPWGQISYWGAAVITNVLASVPYIGVPFAKWLWGGFSIGNPTLNRFFSFHYFLPFVALAGVVVHLSFVHLDESSNEEEEYIGFFYFYLAQDLFVFFCLILVFIVLVFFYPNFFSNPDNYNIASITNTPRHLVPEWYFWPFYALLRAVPDKFGGLVLIVVIIVDIFLIEPTTNDEDNESFTELFVFGEVDEIEPIILEDEEEAGIIFILFYLGGQGLEEPYPDIVTILSATHFITHCSFTFEIDELE